MPAVIMILGLLIFAKNFSIFHNVIGLVILVIGFIWEIKRVIQNKNRDEIIKALCFVTQELSKDKQNEANKDDEEE